MLTFQHILRNSKGVTMTSLIIYVIGMTLVVATIATITSYFYKNVNVEDLKDDSSTQFTAFTSMFSEEINKENNYIIECKPEYIIFASGNQYTYSSENKSIYKNKIKICKNVEQCDFSYTYTDGKYQIKVNFKTKKIDNTNDNAIIYNM